MRYALMRLSIKWSMHVYCLFLMTLMLIFKGQSEGPNELALSVMTAVHPHMWNHEAMCSCNTSMP